MSLRRRWDTFWFEPSGPQNLGVARLLVCSLFLWSHAAWDFSVWTEVSDAFWMPVSLFYALGLDIPSAAFVRVVQIVFFAALFAGAIGWFARASFGVTFVTAIYLFGLRQSFGFVEPSEGHFIIMFAILAMSRCGDAFSVDSVVRRRRGTSTHITEAAHGSYTWPVRLMQTVFVAVFFAGGIAKLRLGGLDWFLSDNLSQTVQVIDLGPLSHWLAGNVMLGKVLAVAALCLELTAPLALFSRRARRVILPSLVLMQIGFAVTMRATFRTFFLTYAFWVPWERLLESAASERSTRRTVSRLALAAALIAFVGWTSVIAPFERSFFPFLR